MGKAWKNSREKTRTWRQTHIFESFCSWASEDQEQKVWATSCTINSLMGVLVAQLCLSLCDPINCSTPGFPVLHYPMSMLKLMSIGWMMLSSHLTLCHCLFLLPSIFPIIRVFSKESALQIRWPKYRSFSFSISPSNEYSRLISFRIEWFDLLVVQGCCENVKAHSPQVRTLINQHDFQLGTHKAISSLKVEVNPKQTTPHTHLQPCYLHKENSRNLRCRPLTQALLVRYCLQRPCQKQTQVPSGGSQHHHQVSTDPYKWF